VVYGIRPEHLELANDGFPGKVAVVEPTGSETMVVVRLGETEVVALFRERHQFAPGQTVHLRPRVDQVHLFDGQSGQRV
jgi:multiple sugar transport system ATP-binding protein